MAPAVFTSCHLEIPHLTGSTTPMGVVAVRRW